MPTRPPLKYRSLLALLDALAELIAAGRLALAAGWDDNEQALRLERPDEPALGAYVFTYGQAQGRYGVELDFPAVADALAAAVPLLHEDLTLPRLLNLLRIHFDLPEHA